MISLFSEWSVGRRGVMNNKRGPPLAFWFVRSITSASLSRAIPIIATSESPSPSKSPTTTEGTRTVLSRSARARVLESYACLEKGVNAGRLSNNSSAILFGSCTIKVSDFVSMRAPRPEESDLTITGPVGFCGWPGRDSFEDTRAEVSCLTVGCSRVLSLLHARALLASRSSFRRRLRVMTKERSGLIEAKIGVSIDEIFIGRACCRTKATIGALLRDPEVDKRQCATVTLRGAPRSP